MKPKDFSEAVQALLGLLIVLAFLYLAVTSSDYKDPMIALVSGVAGYWFGSSQGSKQKTDLINEKTSSGS